MSSGSIHAQRFKIEIGVPTTRYASSLSVTSPYVAGRETESTMRYIGMIASIPSTIRNVFTNFNICETHAGKKLKALRKSPLPLDYLQGVFPLYANAHRNSEHGQSCQGEEHKDHRERIITSSDVYPL